MAKKTKEERKAAREARKQEAADRQTGGASSEALQRQVGGSHYIAKIQHVEFCQTNRMPWCESAAIKYIYRHRSKNGAQDIEKAIHYLELLMAIDYARREEAPQDMDPTYFPISVERFCKENEIPALEAKCIHNICWHQLGGGDGGKDGLMETVQLLKELLKDYKAHDPMDLL